MKFLILALFASVTAFAAVTSTDKAELGTPKNYIANGGAERGVAGFALYKDAAQATPQDATGGSATHLTLGSTTTNPLRGNRSLTIANSGATSAQGEGVSYAFTLDNQDKGSVLNISFAYSLSTGTFQTGSQGPGSITDSDLEVYLYDVTNGVIIQPTIYTLNCGSIVNTNCTFQSAFQTSSSSASYRLAFHVPTTNTASWTMKLDDISIARGTRTFGAVDTDWVSYTPTIVGAGSPTNVQCESRRVGPNLEGRCKFTAGTPSATLASITLGYGGVNANVTAASTSAVTTIYLCGGGAVASNGSNILTSLCTPGQNTVNFSFNANSSGGPLTALNGNSVFTASANHALWWSVPIQGWGSGAIMGTDGDQRIVAFVGTTASASVSTASDTTLTAVTDSVSGWSTNKYTVQIPGYYEATVDGDNGASTAGNFRVYINGSSYFQCSTGVTGSTHTNGACALGYLTAGTTISLRFSGSNTNTNISFGIKRLGGAGVLSVSESVYASYWLSSNQSLTANSTVVNFDTKEIDSHGAVTTGASWVFTAPMPGTYQVSGTWPPSAAADVILYKNNSAYKVLGGASGSTMTGAYSGIVRLSAGDTIHLRSNATQTLGGGTLQNATTATINIVRVGN